MSIETLLNQVKKKYDAGLYSEALEILNRGHKIDPHHKEYWYQKGRILSRLARHEEALVAFEQAIKLNPNDAGPWNGKGIILDGLGHKEEALTAYEQAIKLDPKFTYPWTNKGDTLTHLGREEEALTAYEQAIKLNPNDAYSWNDKGDILNTLGRKEEALLAYEQAIRLDPNDANLWNNKGNILSDLGRKEEALIAYEEVINLKPGDAGPWYNIGNILSDLGRKEEALKVYDQAINLNPNFALPWYNQGIILNDLGEKEKALIAFEQAIRLNPNDVKSWNNKGYTLRNLGKKREALLAYEKAISLDPNFSLAWHGKGVTLSNLGRKKEALIAFEQAINLDPNDAGPWHGKGVTLNDLGRKKEALIAYEQAIEIDPNASFPWNGKGIVLNDLGRNKEALEAYNQAIEIDPNFSYPWYNKGDLLRSWPKWLETTRIRVAQQHFYRAFQLESNPGFLKGLFADYLLYPNYPFFLYSLLVNPKTPMLSFDQLPIWEKTLSQCSTIQLAISYTTAAKRQSGVEYPNLEDLDGILHYFMGHPARAAQILLEEVLIKDPSNTRAHYYSLLCYIAYLEDEEKQLGIAVEVAEKVLNTSESDIQDKAKIIQRYYAALILLLDTEAEDALSCIEPIRMAYLPAAYFYLQLRYLRWLEMLEKTEEEISDQEEKTFFAISEVQEVGAYILQQELNGNPQSTFAHGFPPQALDPRKEAWWMPFYHYAHFIEISQGIGIFCRMANTLWKESFTLPTEIQAFWDTWHIEESVKIAIQEEIKTIKIRELGQQTVQYLSDSLDKTRAESLEHLDPERIDQVIKDFVFQDRYELQAIEQFEGLQKEDQAYLEKRLGKVIDVWSTSHVDFYFNIINYFFLKNQLSAHQAVFLQLFTAYRSKYESSSVNETAAAGAGNAMESMVEKGVAAMMVYISLANPALGVALSFNQPLAAGMVGKLFESYLTGLNKRNLKTYGTLKKDFIFFIGQERERLGPKFEVRYPMYGMEALLEE